MLNKQQIASYHQNGYLSGIPVASPDEIKTFRNSFDELETSEGRENSQNKLFDRHFEHEFIWNIATHPQILDCVEAVLGPNVLLLSTHFFCKYGPAEGFVAWHQDLRYWGLEPPVEVSAWYAVDDSDSENGCMQVIPQLFRDQLVEHGTSETDGNLLSVKQEIKLSKEEEQQAIDCTLKAGEISLHDGMLVHGSLPNRSTRRRCGLTLRYIPTNVKPVAAGPLGTDWKWRAILVRGEDNEGNFDLQPPPFPIREKL